MSTVDPFIHERSRLVTPHPFSPVSDMSHDTNEVPWEYTMGPTPEPQPSPWTFPRGLSRQQTQTQTQWKAKQPQRDADHSLLDTEDEEPAFSRLAHEQRLSACLNSLRHIQRSLRNQRSAAQQQVEQSKQLFCRTAWDLFFQLPREFIEHELPMLARGTVNMHTLPPAQLRGHGQDWLRSLRGARRMREDGLVMEQRAEDLEDQIVYVTELIDAGSREQAAILRGGDPMVDEYRRAFNGAARYGEQDRFDDVGVDSSNMSGHYTGSGNHTSPFSAFVNWPLPSTPPSDYGMNIHGHDDGDHSVKEEESDHFDTMNEGTVPSYLMDLVALLRGLTPQELVTVLKAVDDDNHSS